MVMNPTGCDHSFTFTDIGKREIECELCHFPTTVHIGINYKECEGKAFVSIRSKEYPILLPLL